MSEGLYFEDIVTALSCGCGKPGCTNVAEWLHPRCHKDAGLDARFKDGKMILYCHECKTFVAPIIIAKRGETGG